MKFQGFLGPGLVRLAWYLPLLPLLLQRFVELRPHWLQFLLPAGVNLVYLLIVSDTPRGDMGYAPIDEPFPDIAFYRRH